MGKTQKGSMSDSDASSDVSGSFSNLSISSTNTTKTTNSFGSSRNKTRVKDNKNTSKKNTPKNKDSKEEKEIPKCFHFSDPKYCPYGSVCRYTHSPIASRGLRECAREECHRYCFTEAETECPDCALNTQRVQKYTQSLNSRQPCPQFGCTNSCSINSRQCRQCHELLVEERQQIRQKERVKYQERQQRRRNWLEYQTPNRDTESHQCDGYACETMVAPAEEFCPACDSVNRRYVVYRVNKITVDDYPTPQSGTSIWKPLVEDA